MLIGYNQATSLKRSDVETDLKYAEKYGYDFIEFQMGQLNKYLESHNLRELKEFFNTSKIKPYALNALEFFNLKTPKEFEDVKKEFTRMCEIAKELDCNAVLIVPSKKIEGVSDEEVREDAIDCIGKLAEVSGEYNIRLACEYLGFQDTSINNFAQCYDIIQAVNRADVGIVLDCFHFYVGDSKIENLRNADAGKIFVFHINDCKDLPLNTLQDSDRLWPGEGVIPLDKITGALKHIGFDGVATVELFNPDYWEWDPEETIRVAREKTEAAIKKYFNNAFWLGDNKKIEIKKLR